MSRCFALESHGNNGDPRLISFGVRPGPAFVDGRILDLVGWGLQTWGNAKAMQGHPVQSAVLTLAGGLGTRLLNNIHIIFEDLKIF